MLKRIGLVVLLSGVLIGAGTALAQDGETVEPDKRFVLTTIEGDYAQGPQGYLGVSGNLAGVINPVLRVSVGDLVEVVLINGDGGTHDWVVPVLGVVSERVTRDEGIGATVSVRFTVTEAGEFEYLCTVGSHREEGMFGTLKVDPVDE